MITTPTRERGFSLIEVLVSLLVLSIGLFGILAIILNSLKMNSSSVYRTIAAQQAYAMAETLRANPTAVGTISAATAIAFSTSGVAPAFTQSCLQAAGCPRGTSATNGYVQMSLQMWQDQLASVLPQGTGTICQSSGPPNWACDVAANPQDPFIVQVCWNESRIAASANVVTGSNSGTTGTGGTLCTYTNL